jgi:hypothetical protein
MAAASQTLTALARGFSGFRGIEKNLLAKKYIQSIKYCKESIELNLFLLPAKSPENEKSPAEGGGRFNPEIQNGYSNSLPQKSGCSYRLRSNHIIPIILPNTIHQCRKKNL